MKLLLFDVDGTLVLTGGAAVRAMNDAFEEVFGVRGAFDYVPMPGRTDGAILADAFTRAIPQSQILADALSAAGVRPVDGEIARYKAAYFARFAAEIHKPVLVDPARPTRHRFKGVLPGVREVLEALDGRPDVFLGLLTGNYEQGARIKLEYFDLWRYFRCGAYGDDSLDRHALVPVAVARSLEAGCPAVDPRDVVIIGDTPLDVACARDAGVNCLAVATGGFSVDALRAAGADTVVDSLADTEAVVRVLTGA
jgi:phosphoglycolate phosphatase-like HAD superfamily hydrolase